MRICLEIKWIKLDSVKTIAPLRSYPLILIVQHKITHTHSHRKALKLEFVTGGSTPNVLELLISHGALKVIRITFTPGRFKRAVYIFEFRIPTEFKKFAFCCPVELTAVGDL